ncbi:hypothetical protein KR215_007487 [Drosophila sulfurigaster]|nr:hypothetical protein KR215_007487 [Drosophila sulfurigaster]
MSSTQADVVQQKSKKKWVMCCPKDLNKSPKKHIEKPLPPIQQVNCERIEKLPKAIKKQDEPHCEQSKHYRSPAEKRAHLEKEVVPIFMQGMLELAREQPKDPISYLEKFWLKKQHKCDISLPENLL